MRDNDCICEWQVWHPYKYDLHDARCSEAGVLAKYKSLWRKCYDNTDNKDWVDARLKKTDMHDYAMWKGMKLYYGKEHWEKELGYAILKGDEHIHC